MLPPGGRFPESGSTPKYDLLLFCKARRDWKRKALKGGVVSIGLSVADLEDDGLEGCMPGVRPEHGPCPGAQ